MILRRNWGGIATNDLHAKLLSFLACVRVELFKFIYLSNRKSQLLLDSASVLWSTVHGFIFTDWQHSCCREEPGLTTQAFPIKFLVRTAEKVSLQQIWTNGWRHSTQVSRLVLVAEPKISQVACLQVEQNSFWGNTNLYKENHRSGYLTEQICRCQGNLSLRRNVQTIQQCLQQCSILGCGHHGLWKCLPVAIFTASSLDGWRSSFC